MTGHDRRAELAPRDIVARAIDFEMKKHGLDHVWLDATALGEDFLKSHFPTIHARCAQLGIDIAREPIPVVPAAHYTCGGVVTDLEGRTDLPGLYAIGETSYTGLHGANRLASNSLLECVVLGHACAAHIAAQPPPDMRSVPPGSPGFRLGSVRYAPSPRSASVIRKLRSCGWYRQVGWNWMNSMLPTRQPARQAIAMPSPVEVSGLLV